jgi:hypothetical protein
MPVVRTLLATALAGTFAVVAQGQSLADVAKKAEEERARKAESTKAETPAAKKIYTNQDLVEAPAPAADAPPVDAKTEPLVKGVTAKKASTAPREPLRNEAWWKRRMTGLRQSLDRATAACVAKAAQVQRLQADRDSVLALGVGRAGSTLNALAQARADLASCNAVKAGASRAVADAEEDARTHGVLPGWLR